MSSRIVCPYCHEEFENEPLEEMINPTLVVYKKAKERSSWKDIAQNITDGRIYESFDVGDSIECELKDGRKVLIDVASINLYAEREVIFVFRDAVARHTMNEDYTNHGGFPSSGMNAWLNSDFFDLLPDDLQEVITPRHIEQTIDNEIFMCDSRLWLPSVMEIGGEEYRQHGTDKEELQFDIFKLKKERVKVCDGDTCWWWLRSPYTSNSSGFLDINGYGRLYYIGASYDKAVVPCFFIREKNDIKNDTH